MPIDCGGGASGCFAQPARASGSSIIIHFISAPSLHRARICPDSSWFLHFNYTFAA
jgi:hypothetical protein